MHLAYIYVPSYMVLKNIGLTFDHRYSFSINDGTLIIDKNMALPDSFWENGIYSLTAIVGNNGCGKTTAMLLMKSLFVEGAPRQDETKVIIVYEQQGELYIYNTTDIKVQSRLCITHPLQERRPIETLYYSGHFQPYTGLEGEMQLTGSYEASDAWLLIQDLQDYSNVDTLHLTEPIYNHLLAYYAQNNYRICEVLALKGLDTILESVRLPRFIQFVPNRGGWQAIKLDKKGRYKELDIPEREYLTSRTIKEQALERIIFYDIINLIAEEKGVKAELTLFLNKWMKEGKDEGVITTFEQYIEGVNVSDETCNVLQSMLFIVRKLIALCDYDERSGTFYIDVKERGDNLRMIIEEVIRSPFLLTAKFFDIIYSHTLGENARLSSGELELLNLLSRLYYGITIAPQRFGNISSPRLLLLDEAEIGFHPDWQRRYIKVLNEFIKYMRVVAGVDFQIVITSHSPIILSDIPACCVAFLRRNGEETTQVVDEAESFGENVFNLYRRAFFMENGLIGEFAHKKLNQVIEDIETGSVSEATRKTIALVGDDRIRTYLLKRIAVQDIDSEIAFHEERIRELKKVRAKDE